MGYTTLTRIPYSTQSAQVELNSGRVQAHGRRHRARCNASTGLEVAKLEELGNRVYGLLANGAFQRSCDGNGPGLPPQVGDVHSCAWSPDGTKIAASSHDGIVRVWNVVNLGTPMSAAELRQLRVKELKVLLAGALRNAQQRTT